MEAYKTFEALNDRGKYIFDIVQKKGPITKNEFRRIALFRLYLDCLTRSPTGKVTYDSLYRCRQGLMDSLVIIENYYKSNLKK